MILTCPARILWVPVFACLLLLLASCASRVAPAPVQTGQTSAIPGKVIFGVITAARKLSVGDPQAPIEDGLDGVLAAIQEPKAASGVAATEFVIQTRDNAAVSIVIRAPNHMPGGPVTPGFSVGERVQIVDGAEVELLHSN